MLRLGFASEQVHQQGCTVGPCLSLPPFLEECTTARLRLGTRRLRRINKAAPVAHVCRCTYFLKSVLRLGFTSEHGAFGASTRLRRWPRFVVAPICQRVCYGLASPQNAAPSAHQQGCAVGPHLSSPPFLKECATARLRLKTRRRINKAVPVAHVCRCP